MEPHQCSCKVLGEEASYNLKIKPETFSGSLSRVCDVCLFSPLLHVRPKGERGLESEKRPYNPFQWWNQDLVKSFSWRAGLCLRQWLFHSDCFSFPPCQNDKEIFIHSSLMGFLEVKPTKDGGLLILWSPGVFSSQADRHSASRNSLKFVF